MTGTIDITLEAGWNYVGYHGSKKKVGDALASIWSYVQLIYYYNPETNLWEGVGVDTYLEPGSHYAIQVSQSCAVVDFKWWRFSVVGTGFPFDTSYWMLFYWVPGYVDWVTDGIWHGVNDEIVFSGEKYGGYLGCYCVNYIGQEVSFKQSQSFTAEDEVKYEYDIASGNVHPFELAPTVSQFRIEDYIKV